MASPKIKEDSFKELKKLKIKKKKNIVVSHKNNSITNNFYFILFYFIKNLLKFIIFVKNNTRQIFSGSNIFKAHS